MNHALEETFLQKRLRIKAEREAANQPSTYPHTRDSPRVPLEAGNQRGQRWVDVKLDAQLSELAAMSPDSGRNHKLNAIAYSCGRFIPKWLDEQDTSQRLYNAAMLSGLEHGEAVATIRSGLAGGQQDPRDPPIDPDGTDGLEGLVAGPVVTRTANRVDITLAPGTDNTPAPTGVTEPQQLEPFQGIDLGRLTQPLPDLQWLVDGRMTRATLTLLGSKPGVGKSWIAQALALAAASGGTWLGHDISRPLRVLYLDAENGELLVLRRLIQLGGQDAIVEDRLRYVTESMVFPDARDTLRLRRTLDDFQPDLVIVDTLASIAPTAEAGTEEASTFLAAIWHAVRDRGASMLLLCHLRKVMQGASKDDPLSSFRGAGHLVGAAHRAWVLDPMSDQAFILRDVKTREFAACPPIKVRLVDSGEGTDLRTAVEVEGPVQQLEDGYDSYIANVLTLIDNHPTGAAKTGDLLALTAGSETRRTLERHLARALATGVVKKAGRGLWTRGGTQLDEMSA